MKKPVEFYTSEKQRFENELSSLKKKLATSSTLRLLVFLSTVLGVYFFFGETKIIATIAVIGFVLFLYLI
jgi:hypothetical protein